MSTAQHPSFTSEALIPSVETDLFRANPQAHFWVGRVASEDLVIAPAEFAAARILRANTYIDEWNFLDPSVRQLDGGESDPDDERSTHYSTIRSGGELRPSTVRGNIRAIRKRHESDYLPVEVLFPEAFTGGAAPVNSLEASRFIAKHHNKDAQGAIAVSLIRAVVMQAVQNRQGPVYAVVEKPLESRFNVLGLPFVRIADPRPIKEYNNTINMAVRFDPYEIVAATETDVNADHLLTHFFRSVWQNQGLGYYDKSLLFPLDDRIEQ